MAKEIHKRVNIWLNQQGIENNLKSVKQAITKTANELAKLPIGSDEWLKKSAKLVKLKDIYVELQSEIKDTSAALKEQKKQFNDTIVNAGALGSVYTAASAAFRRFVSATQEYVDAYATLDDAMSAVQKTTGMTREEVEQLHESLKGIDTRTSTNELLKIAEVGGRMGIAKEEIDKFTESVNVANVALGDSFSGGAEEIATVLGKIQGLFEETRSIGIDEAFNSIGSALNSVGAASKATEGNVAQFVQRLGVLPESFKPSIQDAIGLGAAFQDAGIDAEIASTAWANLLTKTAANLDKVAAAMGKPVDELRELINTNPTEFIFQLAESFKGLPIDEQATKLKELRLAGVGCTEAIGALSGNTDNFRRIMAIANEEYAKGTSMMEEYSTVNNSAAAQLEKAKKAVEDAKAALGKELIPTLTKITQSTATSIKLAIEAVKWISDHKALVIALAVAYNRQYIAHMAVVTAKKLSVKWTAMEKAGESAGTVVTNLFALAKAKLAKNTLAAANAQKALKVAFAATPWGAIITAVTTLAAAFIFMRDKTDEAADAQQNLEVQIEQQYNAEKKKVEELQSIIESENTTRDQKLRAIKTLKDLIPGYVAELDKEGKVVNNNRKAIDNYLVALKKKIRYQSLEKALNDTENKIIEANMNYDKAFANYDKQGIFKEAADYALGRMFQGYTSNYEIFENAKNQLQYLYDLRREQQNELKKLDDEFVEETGKTYHELYVENILGDLGAGDSGSGGDGDPDKKLQTKKAEFQKDLTTFMEKQRIAQLSEWEKTKAQIEEQYRQMFDRAKEIYGEGSAEYNETARKLNESKAQTLSDALGKYLKTLSDASDKMKQEAEKMLDSTDPDKKGTPLIKAVFGEQAAWDEKIAAVQKNIASLDEIIDGMNPGDEGWDDILDARKGQFEQFLDLNDKKAKAISNVIRQHTQSDTDFIKDQEKELERARMSDHDRRVAEINDLYNTKIEAKKKEIEALEKLLKDNPENADIAAQIEELKKLIAQLQTAQGNAVAAVPKSSAGQKSIWQQLAEFDWSKMSENWQQGLNLMTQGLQEFANTAFDIYNSIAQVQDNLMQAELQRAQESYDAQSAALQKQLNSGVISQKNYEAKMAKLQEEKEKKEKKLKHEQFEREKTASIIQATINGALAIANVWSTNAGMPILAAVLTAVTAAVTAAQIAAIATQPNPYAKGGYIRGKQYAVMGEQGDEWVASNRLLRDKESSAIIAALDEYQRGNRYALHGITIPAPDAKLLSQAVSPARRTFATPNQTTNNYYQSSDDSELLEEIRQMNKYLKDPKNRQAVINRNILLEYERLENSVKEMARL